MDELNPKEEKSLQEAIRRSKMKDMLGSLKELDETLPEVDVPVVKKVVAKRRKLWPLVAAASVLLMLGVGWYLLRETPMTAGEQLFAERFEPYPALGVTRGGSKANIKQKAYEAYSGGDYKSAADLFETLNATTTDTLSLFYMGIAQLASGEAKNGIKTLSNFKSMSAELQEQAEWYIVLGKVCVGDLDEAALLELEK